MTGRTRRAPTDNDPWKVWIDWIGDAWRKSVESIFETGDRLLAFHKKFEDKHGEWLKAIQDQLRMNSTMVYRLMKLAEHQSWPMGHICRRRGEPSAK
jgi:hypothetical protein